MFDLSGSGAEPLEDEDPRSIGGIPLVGRLGAGGMGRVYLGVHERRYVAVKQLLSSVVGEDKDFLRRFGHELDNLSRLPAGATAPLLASDRTALPPWLATAYVPGLTLREAVELNEGPLPVDALWLLLREAASGLADVHALDMVHRDLKPSNVMLTLDGFILIDFGVARAADQSQLTRTGMVVGTPAYMSPEQASGARRLSGAVDVFALGSVLAYAASGCPPFGDESGHGVLYRIVHEEPDLQPVRDLDPRLAEVVAACLDKDPEGRPTAAELLEQAAEHGPFADRPWPEAVTEPLAERAAFAADEARIDEVPEPAPTLPAAGAEPAPEPGQQPESKSEARPGPRERRRTRVLFAVVPVVVVAAGTTLAIQHLPYTSSPDDEARATPSVSVTASTGSTPTSTGSPSTSPSAHRSSSPGAKESGGKGAGGSQAGGTGGTGAGAQGDSDGGGNTGSGSASSGSSGSSLGTSGGSSTTAPASTGYYRLKNASDGQCLVMSDFSGPVLGECSDSPASSWTYKSASGSTFHVVNEHTGQCLSVSAYNLVSAACDQSTQQTWRTGSGSTLQNMSNSRCLDESSGWPVTSTCVSGTTSQRWTRV
ncbi:protein kinase domain-containing protein [Streptomyces sp. NBC_00005]|uniref:protein kinase domain-containing protein n=1 Tax=Streptomyces sp. NBC_00005 TaxID=2903609 RepID=UPI0032456083